MVRGACLRVVKSWVSSGLGYLCVEKVTSSCASLADDLSRRETFAPNLNAIGRSLIAIGLDLLDGNFWVEICWVFH